MSDNEIVPEEKWGVHKGHCCVFHGCKYGHDSVCPVVQEKVVQAYECEYCDPEMLHPNPDKRLGLYKHFKGRVYELIAIATDSATLEEVAVYHDKNYKTWTRPWKEFDDVHPEHNVKRFEKL